MARTNIPLTALVANSSVAQPAGTNVDPTNGHNILAAGLTQRVILRINNTTVGAKNVTIKKGDAGPGQRVNLGDVVIACAGSTVYFAGPFESARFVQDDGSIDIDCEAGMTGTIAALQVPGGL